jgi:hypothetical protein
MFSTTNTAQLRSITLFKRGRKMALDAVGSTIYVNQQMASVAAEQNSRIARVEMQNVSANIAVIEAEKEVEAVRPTEENQAIDADREHQRQENDEEQKRSQKKKHDSEDEETEPLHHLDIKV